MTRSELVLQLARRFPQIALRDAEYSVKMIIAAMTHNLRDGRRIEIRGFGSFERVCRRAHVGRNPKSGETVNVPEKYVPHFRVGKELRERVG